MSLAGKGVIKWQNEWYGLWDLGRSQDIHPSIHSFIQHICPVIQLSARPRLGAGLHGGVNTSPRTGEAQHKQGSRVWEGA